MKKVFITIMMALCVLAINAQEWETIETKDSFGDKTGETASVILLDGVFSNSATSDSELIVRIVKYSKFYTIALFEYGSAPKASLVYEGTTGNLHCKKEDGTTIDIYILASDDGTLYVNNDYQKFKLLLESGSVKFYIGKSDFDNNGSSYLFKYIKP